MLVLVLMAGEGSRFKKEAARDTRYLLPKPLIPVKGQTILEWTTRSLPLIRHLPDPENVNHLEADRLIFAIREEPDLLRTYLSRRYGSVQVIRFTERTQGNLETAFIATNELDPEEELLILDADNAYQGENFLRALDRYKREYGDVAALIAYFHDEKCKPKWCFAEMNEERRVLGLYEKDEGALARGAKPMVGVFYFKSVAIFRSAAQTVIASGKRAGHRMKPEFYLSQAVQRLVDQKESVFGCAVDPMIALGTPEDLEAFESQSGLDDAHLY